MADPGIIAGGVSSLPPLSSLFSYLPLPPASSSVVVVSANYDGFILIYFCEYHKYNA